MLGDYISGVAVMFMFTKQHESRFWYLLSCGGVASIG